MESRKKELDKHEFINEQIKKIREAVGDELAINALSGGVDSSTVTMLGRKALGDKLKTYFIENGLMRQDEARSVVSVFKKFGVPVMVVKAKNEFFGALRGITNPEEKREAITQTFYKKVFGRLVRESGAKCLLQGTNLTDIEETAAGIKRQHNVFEQIGIDPQETFGYKIIEPLASLRKDAIRKVAQALGLPESICNRMPFPGPALVTRVIGEVTPKKVKIIRRATKIVEENIKNAIREDNLEKIKSAKRLEKIINEINPPRVADEFSKFFSGLEVQWLKPFQYLAILHDDRVTGIRNGKREFGMQIEIRCWDSLDARTATPTRLSYEVEVELADRITNEIPEVVSVTFNRSKKPPSTMEAI